MWKLLKHLIVVGTNIQMNYKTYGLQFILIGDLLAKLFDLTFFNTK